MKVQVNKESELKFSSDYFEKEAFVNKIYKYEYGYQDGKVMHIAFNIDESFCMPMGVTITSILENNKDVNFAFHVFIDGINQKDKELLENTMKKYNANCYVYIMNMEQFSNFHIKHKRFKHVAYFRLYMNKVLYKITDRFLYLDADLICISSMKPFFDIDLEGKIIAAVEDYPEAVTTRSKFLGLEHGHYLDSGMMLVDCKAWEENQITEKCFAYQGVSAEKFTCHDHDVLNLVLDGHVCYVDVKFNFMGIYWLTTPKACIIYHFFGRVKPWGIAVSDEELEWRRYLSISLWEDMPNPLPPKQGQYYFYYKYAADYYRHNGDKMKELSCKAWYSVLKIASLLGL